MHHESVHKYIRYTARSRNGNMLEKMGLFASAYKLRDSKALPASEQQELLECLLWFQRHVRLACLDELSDLDQQAVCWYKNPDHPLHDQLHSQLHSQLHNQPAHEQFNLDDAFSAEETPACNKEISICYEASAQEALIQTEVLTAIMQRHGFLVQVEYTSDPGIILWEDSVQIAAIPARNRWHALRLRLQLWRQRNIPTFC